MAEQRILNCGARFSLNASGPSLASSERNTSMPILVSILKASFSCRPSVSRIDRRIACTASGPLSRDHLGDLQRLLQRLAVGHHMADQPVLQSLGRGDVPAGQQQIAGDRVRNLAYQPHRRAAHRVQAPLRLGDTELRALAGHPDVGALQDLGAAGDGRALDGGDQRLGQPAALEQAVDAGRVVAAVLERVARRLGGGGLEVHPRAEVAAGAGEDADPDVGIVVDAVPGLDHDREHLAGQRVARLGPVHRHDEDVPALLDQGVSTFGAMVVRLPLRRT